MDPRVEVEIARRYLVGNWQSINKHDPKSWGICREEERIVSGKEMPREWHTLPDRILTASPHLQGYDVPGEEIDNLKAQGLTLLEALEHLGIG